jgi:hypothetical protein
MTQVTLFICDKDSDKINVRHFNISDVETTKSDIESIFAEADIDFRRYFVDAESDGDLTEQDEAVLRQTGVFDDLIDLI